MKTISKRFLWVVVLLTILGCAKRQEPPENSVPEPTQTESKENVADKLLRINNRKIIKEGEIHFESSNLAQTRNQIDKAIEKFGGYISKETEYRYSDRIQQSLVVSKSKGRAKLSCSNN